VQEEGEDLETLGDLNTPQEDNKFEVKTWNSICFQVFIYRKIQAQILIRAQVFIYEKN
jgi:hypothetical protein